MKKKDIGFFAALLAGMFLLSGLALFLRYASNIYEAKPHEDSVSVEEADDRIVYGDPGSGVGLVFYPGARVDEAAYAPVMDELAEAGVCCIVAKMPLHLAVFGASAAEGIMGEYPEIESWYVGGHSLGGAMAVSYAAGHGEGLEGVILLAAYSTREIDGLPVLAVYGSEDGVLDFGKYEKGKGRVADFTERVIEGGNHANFGNYGDQKGDGEAYLAREEQWQETVDYILSFIRETSGRERPAA